MLLARIYSRIIGQNQDFERKYGGRVFIIFSTKKGDKKEIYNKEVIKEIVSEIAKLKELNKDIDIE